MLNLHAIAAGVIPQQKIMLSKFKQNTTNSLGLTVPEYGEAEEIEGSLQPMNADDASILGLVTRATNATLYTSANVELAGEGTQADKISYNGKTFEPISVEDWSGQAGWRVVQMVQK